MSRHRNLLFALCGLLFVTQATGAHLHLCLDGQEPPVQLHLPGASEHHDADELSRPHSDLEVTLHGGPSSHDKQVKVDLEPAIHGGYALDLRPATGPILALGLERIPLYTVTRDRLPPSRGPPDIA